MGVASDCAQWLQKSPYSSGGSARYTVGTGIPGSSWACEGRIPRPLARPADAPLYPTEPTGRTRGAATARSRRTRLLRTEGVSQALLRQLGRSMAADLVLTPYGRLGGNVRLPPRCGSRSTRLPASQPARDGVISARRGTLRRRQGALGGSVREHLQPVARLHRYRRRSLPRLRVAGMWLRPAPL